MKRHHPIASFLSRNTSTKTDQDRNFWALCSSAFFLGISLGGLVSFMPVFLARLGASTQILGVYNAVPGLLMGLLMLPGSALAERFSDQTRLRCLTQSVKRIMQLCCGLLPFFFHDERLICVLVIVWTVITLFDALSTPAFTTVMSRAVDPSRRARLNSVRWAAMALAMALSSAGCGWLLDQIVFPLNYQVVFLVTAFLSLIDPIIYSRVRIEPFATPVRSSDGSALVRAREFLRPIVHHKPFFAFVLRTMPFRLALNLAVPLYSLFWVNDLAATDTLIGLRGTVSSVALVVGYLMWGRLAGRVGHRSVAVLGGLGSALYPILTSRVPTAMWLLPVAAVWGLSVGGIDVGLFDMMLGYSPREMQPRFGAVWMMIGQFSVFAGPMLGVALSSWLGLRGALAVAGVLQFLSLGLMVRLPRDC